jgi:hypothetical protein
MSAAQFTPGPHEAEPSEHLGAHAYAIRASDGDFLAVGCTLWDAYLFAAAPELYEALALFVAEYVELVESGDAGFWDAEKESKVIIARAALAKARGEQ